MTSRGWFEVQGGWGRNIERVVHWCVWSQHHCIVGTEHAWPSGPFSRAGPLVRSCGSTAFSPSSHHSFFAY